MITRYKDKLNIPKNVPAGDKEKFEKYVGSCALSTLVDTNTKKPELIPA